MTNNLLLQLHIYACIVKVIFTAKFHSYKEQILVEINILKVFNQTTRVICH
jgi:hypothetical protein